MLNSLVTLGQAYSAQHDVNGLPYMNHYRPSDYNSHRQNWCVIQDHRGIIYVGNNSGLLEYDGSEWRSHKTSNNTSIRSLGIDKNGKIYYGAQDDFGYLDNTKKGELVFVSLIDNLPMLSHRIRDVWGIQVVNDLVYFQSNNHLFSFDVSNIEKNDKTVKLIYESENSSEEINGLSLIDNDLYVWIFSKGLMRLNENTLQVVKGSKLLARREIVKSLPIIDQKSVLICTLGKGFYLSNGNTIEKLNTSLELEQLLLTNRIFDIRYLSDGKLAVATNKAGLLVIDKDFKILQKINKSNGLLSDTVYNTFSDAHGGLWLATDQGISRLELPSAIQKFEKNFGLNGVVYDFAQNEESLYIGTKFGAFEMRMDSTSTEFFKVGDISDDVFSLELMEDELFGAFPYQGVYILNNESSDKLIDKELPVKVKKSRHDPNLMFIGSGSNNYGFAIMYKHKSGWKRYLTTPVIKDQIREIEEKEPGVIWLGTRRNGVLRLHIPNLKTLSSLESGLYLVDSIKLESQRYAIENSTATYRSRLWWVNDTIRIATSNGLRKMDVVSNTLVLDNSLNEKLTDSSVTVNIIKKSADDTFWVYSDATKNTLAKLKQEHGHYKWEEVPELNRTIGTVFTALHPDIVNPDLLYLGTSDGIITYDSSVNRSYNADYNTSIRRVFIEQDSLVYNGTWFGFKKNRPFSTFNFSREAIRFVYAATSYDMPELTLYQTFLEGYDKDWSSWTSEVKKDYTNLPGGDYTFKIKAKNVYGIISSEDEYVFSITPPWYLSTVAYIIYTVLSILGVIAVLRYRENKILERQKIELASLENKFLKTEIKYKQKDLADFAVNISQNQKWASHLLERVKEIKATKGRTKGKNIELLEQEIKDKTTIEKSKLDFQKRIDVLNNAFYDSLLKSYPDLTKTEMKLCSLIKLNLDSHDIAILQNVTLESVYKSRTRLRKKLKLASDVDLNVFLKQF
ncbi:triple tyrosine motif-containing protein [uncultured Winogradskyella sp.]|uniref:triple tyrosine motif-containing protein n=1 Tax=uncultured Winogradskyella sp. TaxID=395353 RepID=UPI00262AB5A2|nr:triple tyrosine motif-containing protein [uncultured Winogradskyella sp.]